MVCDSASSRVMNTFTSSIIAVLAAGLTAQAATEAWVRDWAKAKATASESKRDGKVVFRM